MSDYISLKVKDVIRETDDAVTIQFKQPLFKKVKYEAGQFFTVILNLNGNKERRAYSISSAPHLDNYPAITVKRVRGGLVSNYLNDKVKEGDTIELMKAMGNFTIAANKELSRHIVLIGGGSGITPLISILKTVLYLEPKSTASLIYANSNENGIIFKQKLDELKVKFGERFNLVHVLSKPEKMHNGYTGRLDGAMIVNILNLLPKFSADSTEYYVCGPEGLMEAAREGLRLAKVASKQIRTESFFMVQATPANVGGETKQVTIQLRGVTHQVSVPGGTNILDAALDAGLDMPFSCQSGVCTACMGKCTAGEVTMTNPDGLSDSELNKGYRLLCVGYPASDGVVIDME